MFSFVQPMGCRSFIRRKRCNWMYWLWDILARSWPGCRALLFEENGATGCIGRETFWTRGWPCCRSGMQGAGHFVDLPGDEC